MVVRVRSALVSGRCWWQTSMTTAPSSTSLTLHLSQSPPSAHSQSLCTTQLTLTRESTLTSCSCLRIPRSSKWQPCCLWLLELVLFSLDLNTVVRLASFLVLSGHFHFHFLLALIPVHFHLHSLYLSLPLSVTPLICHSPYLSLPLSVTPLICHSRYPIGILLSISTLYFILLKLFLLIY